jgi:hypothetical protein
MTDRIEDPAATVSTVPTTRADGSCHWGVPIQDDSVVPGS